MIVIQCLEKEWIEEVSKRFKADKILVEKVIRALFLLEGLAVSDFNFSFKGGTALMLLLKTTKRLSIDIDIIVPDTETDMDVIVDGICAQYRFTHFEKQGRKVNSAIDKSHYKLYFTSALTNKESHILLDVLREKIHYNRLVETPVDCHFIKVSGNPVTVKTPDFNNILADKLTAFAPNTTGIPYLKRDKEMGMEIIKQLYDIGCIYDQADDMANISPVFSSFVNTELKYRMDKRTEIDVLDDIVNTAMAICLRKDIDSNSRFDILNKGIVQARSFIFSEPYHIEKAITHAAKAAYLATMIKQKTTEIDHHYPKIDMKDWTIGTPLDTKLNKLKKSNPEAFFYVYRMYELLREVRH